MNRSIYDNFPNSFEAEMYQMCWRGSQTKHRLQNVKYLVFLNVGVIFDHLRLAMTASNEKEN